MYSILSPKYASLYKQAETKIMNDALVYVEVTFLPDGEWGMVFDTPDQIAKNNNLPEDAVVDEKLAHSEAEKIRKEIWGDNVVQRTFQDQRAVQERQKRLLKNRDLLRRKKEEATPEEWRDITVKKIKSPGVQQQQQQSSI